MKQTCHSANVFHKISSCWGPYRNVKKKTNKKTLNINAKTTTSVPNHRNLYNFMHEDVSSLEQNSFHIRLYSMFLTIISVAYSLYIAEEHSLNSLFLRESGLSLQLIGASSTPTENVLSWNKHGLFKSLPLLVFHSSWLCNKNADQIVTPLVGKR